MLGVHRQQLRDNSTAVSKERWSPEPRPCKRTGDPAVPHPFCWGQRVPFCTGERRTTPQRSADPAADAVPAFLQDAKPRPPLPAHDALPRRSLQLPAGGDVSPPSAAPPIGTSGH